MTLWDVRLHRNSKFDRVVRRVNQVLSRPEITLHRLYRRVAEEHLDLFKLAARCAAQLRARAALMPHALSGGGSSRQATVNDSA